MVKAIYHNDRTLQQSQSIIDYLISRGANEGKLAGFVNAIPATLPDNKKTMVKVRIMDN